MYKSVADAQQQLIKCKLLLSIYSQLWVVHYGGFGRWSIVGIKGKLLLSIYSQLCVLQYGEFGRSSLVGVKVCLTTNSSNTVHTFCSWQVGRIKVRIFRGEKHLMSYKQLALGRSLSRQPTCKQKSNAYTCRNVVERKLFNLYSFCIKFSFLLVLTHLQRLCQRTELLAKLFHILFTWLHRHKLTVRGKNGIFFSSENGVFCTVCPDKWSS